MKKYPSLTSIARSSLLTAVAALVLVNASNLLALPFNDDMVHSQIVAGQFYRPKVEGTVPLGTVSSYIPPKAEAAKLENPVPATSVSVLRGKRLYSANCQGCHGVIGAKEYKPGVAGALMGAPNIADDLYKQKSDGHIFSIIRYGGLAIMPRLGWKLSQRETWDIVNYVRHVQNTGKPLAPKALETTNKK